MTISVSNMNYDSMMKKIYSSNKTARKKIIRPTLKPEELIKADSEALQKIAKNLRGLEYNSDNGEYIYNNVKALVETYNNLVDSAGSNKIHSRELTRYQKNLTNTIKKYKDDLEKIGIKITSSGKLDLDKETLATSSATKVGKVLGNEELTGAVVKYTRSINKTARYMLINGTSADDKKSAAEAAALQEWLAEANPSTIDFKA